MQQQPKTLNEFFLTFKDAANAAFENTKAMLWPFKFKKWITLAVTTLCASWATFQPSFRMPSAGSSSSRHAQNSLPSLPNFNISEIVPSLLIIAIAVFLIFIFSLIIIHIGSRFKFILFRNILNRDSKISEYWSEVAPRGKHLFFWVIIMSIIFIPVILLTFSMMFLPAILPRIGENAKTFFLLFSSCLGAAFLLFLSLSLLFYNGLIYTFTLPAMMKMDEETSVWSASWIIINKFIKMGITGILSTTFGLFIFYTLLSLISLFPIALAAIPLILILVITIPLVIAANNPVVYIIGGTIIVIAFIIFFIFLFIALLPLSIFRESFNFALTSLLFPEYDTFFTRSCMQDQQQGIEGSPGSTRYYDYSETKNEKEESSLVVSLEKKDDNPHNQTNSI